MNKKVDINLKRLFNKYFAIFVFTLFFSVLGATYAYFAFSSTNSNTVTGNAATVNLTLTVNRILPTKTNSGVMVPQKSVSGDTNSALSTALKSGCVDDNTNIVCQVYKIYIENSGGTATSIVDGAVSFYANSNMTVNSYDKMPNLKWKLITSVDTSNNTNSVLGSNADNIASSTASDFVNNVTMVTNDDNTYYMIVWFDETNSDQVDEGNTYYGKVEFTSSNGTGVTSTFSVY